MNRDFSGLWQALQKGGPDQDLEREIESLPRALPVIWLLGRTGAGKSSLIRALTGLDAAAVGSGFGPCTRTAQAFDFPEARPLMRFLDTRGLGEADYDPAEDLAACEQGSHVVLALARLDDPVQEDLARALTGLRRRRPELRPVLVHTGADLLPDDEERRRARSHTQARLERAAGAPLPWVELALPPDRLGADAPGLDRLRALLEESMPEVALLLARRENRGAEREAFGRCRAEILWYAGAAGTSDLAPVVGTLSVPAIQAAMLRALARRYGLAWNRARVAEFSLALGAGAALRYGGSHLLRQALKLIPVYGQSAGAAGAGTLSFAATYALGRAAAYYLHRSKSGQRLGGDARDELRRLYRDALRGVRHERS